MTSSSRRQESFSWFSAYDGDSHHPAANTILLDARRDSELGPRFAPAGLDYFPFPQSFGLQGSGVLYIADPGNHRVIAAHLTGTTVTSIVRYGSHGQGPTNLNAPVDVRRSGTFGVFIADRENHRVVRVAMRNVGNVEPITVVAGADHAVQSGTSVSFLNRAVAVAPVGEFLFVLDGGNRRIVRWPAVRDSGPAGGRLVVENLDAVLTAPFTTALHGLGYRLFFANPLTRQVRGFSNVQTDGQTVVMDFNDSRHG